MKELVCIVCPNGCRLKAELSETGAVAVTGNACSKGAAFAETELKAPRRTLCTTVRTADPARPVLPVRTAGDIPKELLPAAVAALGLITVAGPVRCGDIVMKNLLATGIDVIATETRAG